MIDKYASNGDEERFTFPHSDIPDLDFSFSGIKTAVLYFVRDRKEEDPSFVENNIGDVSASLQKTLVDMLMDKLEKAVLSTGIKEVAIAGGVAANSKLRSEVFLREKTLGWKTYIPSFEYCTDNAAMIAIAAYFRYQAQILAKLDTTPQARLEF
jgi:N6-L-threonylcarbamoyladenine synthase